MQKIEPGKVTKYAFDWRDEPVLRVAQGEAFQLETDDALSGLIADDSDNPLVHGFTGEHAIALQKVWPPAYNPVIGPIHVEGCERGDTLAVSIDWIDPWRYGFSGILPGIGLALAVVYFARCHIHNDLSELIGVARALFSKTCHRPNYRILQNNSPVAVNPPQLSN